MAGGRDVKVELPDADRALWLQMLERCTAEGTTVTEATMAWWRRALRQERSVLPQAQAEKDNLLQMRGR